MSSVLSVISISLNLVAFLAIMILYVRQNRLKEVEKSQAKIVEDMEQSIAAFVIQMQEDNEVFLKKLKEAYNQKQTDTNISSVPVKTLEPTVSTDKLESKNVVENTKTYINPLKNVAVNKYKQSTRMETKANPKDDLLFSHVQSPSMNNENVGQASSSEDIKSLLDEIKPLEELPLNDQIRLLKKQGLTNEQIAQNLKMGKTELELIIKFNSIN